jgi:hypothetical protein
MRVGTNMSQKLFVLQVNAIPNSLFVNPFRTLLNIPRLKMPERVSFYFTTHSPFKI